MAPRWFFSDARTFTVHWAQILTVPHSDGCVALRSTHTSLVYISSLFQCWREVVGHYYSTGLIRIFLRHETSSWWLFRCDVLRTFPLPWCSHNYRYGWLALETHRRLISGCVGWCYSIIVLVAVAVPDEFAHFLFSPGLSLQVVRSRWLKCVRKLDGQGRNREPTDKNVGMRRRLGRPTRSRRRWFGALKAAHLWSRWPYGFVLAPQYFCLEPVYRSKYSTVALTQSVPLI